MALQAIDVICRQVMVMDARNVAAKRTRSFHAGWEEPSFFSTGIPDLKSNRPIVDASRFMYSRQ